MRPVFRDTRGGILIIRPSRHTLVRWGPIILCQLPVASHISYISRFFRLPFCHSKCLKPTNEGNTGYKEKKEKNSQSSNQSINACRNQSINLTIKQSINQSVQEPINQPNNQAINQCMHAGTNQST
jgi:hypothetical protein